MRLLKPRASAHPDHQGTAGRSLSVEAFEYLSAGEGAALARLSGRREPSARYPRLALLVEHAGAEERVDALPSAPGQDPADVWRAGFPLAESLVRDPEVGFTLLVDGEERISLPLPVSHAAAEAPELDDEREEGENDRARLLRQLKASQWARDGLVNQLTDEREARNGAELQLWALRRREAQLKEELDAAREQSAALEHDHGERQELEAQLAALQAIRRSDETELADHRRKVASLREELAEMGQRLAELEARLQRTGGSSFALEEQLQEDNEARGEAEQRLGVAEQQLHNLRAELVEARRAAEEAERRAEDAEQRLREIERRADAGDELEEAAGGELDRGAPVVAFPAAGPCSECEASGVCPRCEGTGRRLARPCRGCGGTGRCPMCGGTGMLQPGAQPRQAPRVHNEDLDAARTIAIEMAINENSRDEIERYIRQNFDVLDALLDEVYSTLEAGPPASAAPRDG